MNKIFVLSMIAIEIATAIFISINIKCFLIPFLPKLSEFNMWQKYLFCGSVGSGIALVFAIMGSGFLEMTKEIMGRATKAKP
jgi:hypothetical protein